MNNRITKCSILCAAFFFLVSGSFASELVNPSDASVIHTEWFEIIYNAPQEPTARRLASMADQVYLQANHDMGVEPQDHLCVVVSGVTQNINAYWTDFPYDHLVVYDAAPDIWDLASYDDTLRSVFYHELIHHVTLTMTDPDSNPLFRFLQRILYLASKLNMSVGFSEGATVSKESQHQDGRLQNGYVLHTLVQAKAEGKARHWEDMSGTRDVQSIGSWAYYMGGAFARYLQDTYGDEKYTLWWQKSAHLNIGFTTRIFKQVYGLNLQDVWKAFYDTIPEVSFTDAFSTPVTGRKLSYGSFGSLTVVGGDTPGLALINGTDYSIQFYPLLSDGTYGPAEKWQTINGTTSNLAVRADGTLYAVSALAATSEDRYETRICNRDGTLFQEPIADMRFCTFVTLPDGKAAIAGVKTRGYRSVLTVIPCGTDDPLFERLFTFNDELYAIAPGPGKTAAVLEKTDGNWKVVLYDLTDGSTVYEALLPENIIPRYLAAVTGQPGRYTLTVAGHTMDGGTATVPGAVPRGAELLISNDSDGWHAVLSYDQENVSGGVYNPVVTENGELIAVRKESDGSLLVKGTAGKRIEVLLEEGSPAAEITAEVPAATDVTFTVTKYNRFGYPLDGKLLPFDVYPYEPNMITQSELPPLGASWVSSDPAGSFWYLAGVGYYPFINQVTLNLNLSGDAGPVHWSAFTQYYRSDLSIVNSMNSLVLFSLGLSNEIDMDPVSRLYNNLMLTTGFYPGTRNAYQQFMFVGQTTQDFVKKYTTGALQVSSQFQYAVKKGSSVYETAGFALAAMPWSKAKYDWMSGRFNMQNNMELEGIIMIPHLIPVKNPNYYTLNLPVTLTGQIMPVVQDPILFDVGILGLGQISAILFSREIQSRLVPGLYANRITLSASYTAGIVKSGVFTNWELFSLPQDLLAGRYADAKLVQMASVELYAVSAFPFGSLAQNPVKMGAKASIDLNNPKNFEVTWSYVMESGAR